MQKFIFVITSILILCLIGCSDVVGQGTGGSQDVITNQENNSALTNNEYDSPEREIEMLKMQNLDLDQYNKQLRSDIEKMQKDIQQEQMINNILQEDITNLSNELQKQQQTMLQKQQQTLLDSAGPSVEELLDAEILTTYIKSSLVEIYNNSQGDQVKFMTEAEKIISEVNNIILGQGNVNSLGNK